MWQSILNRLPFPLPIQSEGKAYGHRLPDIHFHTHLLSHYDFIKPVSSLPPSSFGLVKGCITLDTALYADLHEEDALVSGCLDELPGVRGIHGERLLTEHRLASFKHHHHSVVMLGVDVGHVHHIHLHMAISMELHTNKCAILYITEWQPLSYL